MQGVSKCESWSRCGLRDKRAQRRTSRLITVMVGAERDDDRVNHRPKEDVMKSTQLVDCAGRRRSPATPPGYHRGRSPRNKGLRYPADPPTLDRSELTSVALVLLVVRPSHRPRFALSGLVARPLGINGKQASVTSARGGAPAACGALVLSADALVGISVPVGPSRLSPSPQIRARGSAPSEPRVGSALWPLRQSRLG